MTQYAVTDPRTGERVSDVPTDTDEQVLAAVASAHRTPYQLGSHEPVADRASLVRRVAELHTERREELADDHRTARWASRWTTPLGEVDFCADIYGYYADHAEEFLADEPIALLGARRSALIRRAPARRAARDHAVELPLLPGRPVRRPRTWPPATRSCSSTPRSARSPPRPLAADLQRRRLPRGRLRQHLRHERADRDDHRATRGSQGSR